MAQTIRRRRLSVLLYQRLALADNSVFNRLLNLEINLPRIKSRKGAKIKKIKMFRSYAVKALYFAKQLTVYSL